MNDKIVLYQLINSINKKRKIDDNRVKKRKNSIKIVQKHIKTTQIDKKMQKIVDSNIDIFSLVEFYKNKDCLCALSKYLSLKINSQIGEFRGVKTATIVEIVAKRTIKECFCGDIYNIDKYIISNYNILYKKEIRILPYLLLNEILFVLCNIVTIFCNYRNQIISGARLKVFKNNQKYSLAKIYGMAKYNPNLLKYMQISNVNIKKCVFAFISKLVWYQNKIQLIFKMIDNLKKYTTFRQGQINARLDSHIA